MFSDTSWSYGQPFCFCSLFMFAIIFVLCRYIQMTRSVPVRLTIHCTTTTNWHNEVLNCIYVRICTCSHNKFHCVCVCIFVHVCAVLIIESNCCFFLSRNRLKRKGQTSRDAVEEGKASSAQFTHIFHLQGWSLVPYQTER